MDQRRRIIGGINWLMFTVWETFTNPQFPGGRRNVHGSTAIWCQEKRLQIHSSVVPGETFTNPQFPGTRKNIHGSTVIWCQEKRLRIQSSLVPGGMFTVQPFLGDQSNVSGSIILSWHECLPIVTNVGNYYLQKFQPGRPSHVAIYPICHLVPSGDRVDPIRWRHSSVMILENRIICNQNVFCWLAFIIVPSR